MTEDSFKDAPQSIAEIKSDKTSRAKDWTVRDMLISTLRDIDNGKIKPYMGVLIFSEGARTNDDGKNVVWHSQAGVVSYVETLGLLMRAIQISDPDKP